MHDSARYRKHLSIQDAVREVEMSGDGEEEFDLPLDETFFEVMKKKKQCVYHMFESGLGAWHSCDFGLVMKRDLVKPILHKGLEWVKDGKKGYEVELNFVIYGVIEQNPPSHWVSITSKRFKLDIPSSFRDVLGKEFVIDGCFALVGEKPSRMKKTRVQFIEREKGVLKANIPCDTKVKINWKEALIPEPMIGIWWWGMYVEMVSWRAWN